jgi:hypothetical protein
VMAIRAAAARMAVFIIFAIPSRGLERQVRTAWRGGADRTFKLD